MTKVIASNEPFGDIETNALAINWGLHGCCIEGCECDHVAAIVRDTEYGVMYGLCRKHFEQLDTPGPHDVQITDFVRLDMESGA